MSESIFSVQERSRLLPLVYKLRRSVGVAMQPEDYKRLLAALREVAAKGHYSRDRYGMHPLIHNLETACALCERVSPDRNMVIAVMLGRLCRRGAISIEDIESTWGKDTAKLVGGMVKVSTLYAKQSAVESDNFRSLLLTFAEDIRVIIIMIVERMVLMRAINHHPDNDFVQSVAREANYLYAPLAHRLGLYSIKSELEDMSLKYTNRDIYTKIARKLNETKVKRDAYIADFIKPIREKLKSEGLDFEIKGRTKSIYSIWNKIKKQKVDLDHIYDLFAIRIILNVPKDKEKSECWLAYSLITDMYRPNPSRMKDWLSIPKSNGYESLNITVYGTEDRWV